MAWLEYGAYAWPSARNEHEERDVLHFVRISLCGRGLSSLVRQALEVSVREMRNADARGGIVLGGVGYRGNVLGQEWAKEQRLASDSVYYAVDSQLEVSVV